MNLNEQITSLGEKFPLLSFHTFAPDTPDEIIKEAFPHIEVSVAQLSDFQEANSVYDEDIDEDYTEDDIDLHDVLAQCDIVLIVTGYSLITAEFAVQCFVGTYDMLLGCAFVNEDTNTEHWDLETLVYLKQRSGGLIVSCLINPEYLTPLVELTRDTKWKSGGEILRKTEAIVFNPDWTKH